MYLILVLAPMLLLLGTPFGNGGKFHSWSTQETGTSCISYKKCLQECFLQERDSMKHIHPAALHPAAQKSVSARGSLQQAFPKPWVRTLWTRAFCGHELFCKVGSGPLSYHFVNRHARPMFSMLAVYQGLQTTILESYPWRVRSRGLALGISIFKELHT